MVQDRKEPTINTIAPDRDEILSHQNRMGGGGAKRPPNQRPPNASRPVVKSSPLGGFAFILAVAAMAGAGFAGWQLYETQNALTEATARIESLETQLDLNNDKSSSSVDKIFDRLDDADSEIRKLWGVSYDTNRKAIAANKDEITAVAGRLNDAAEAAEDANKSMELVKEQVNQQQLVVDRVVEDMNIQEQQIQDISELAQAMENTTKQLETRVANSEEAIEAINAFRRSANADIQMLKQRLGAPSGG